MKEKTKLYWANINLDTYEDGIESFKRIHQTTDQIEVIDITIRYKDQTKDFTFDDFLKKLEFDK